MIADCMVKHRTFRWLIGMPLGDRHQGIQIQQGKVTAFIGIPAACVYVVDIAKARRAAYRGVPHHQGDEILDTALVQPLDAAP